MEEIETSIWEYGSTVFEGGLLSFVLRSAVILLIAAVIGRILHRTVEQQISRGVKNVMVFRYLDRTVRTIIYAIAVLIVLSGIKSLSSLSTAFLGVSSVLAVILGLAAQETFGNYISGVLLTVHQPFKIGDMVTLPEKNISGWVQEVTFRHTVLSTYENTTVIVPNNMMDEAVIVDMETENKPYTRYLDISVAYDTDMEKAKSVISNAVISDEGFIDFRSEEQIRMNVPQCDVKVWEFLDSGVQLHFPVSCHTYLDSFAVCSRIRERILVDFRKEGIVIPYPVRSIYMPQTKENLK